MVTTRPRYAFEDEFSEIAREYEAAAKANEEVYGIPIAFPGEGLEEMRNREATKADRLIRAALDEFKGTRDMPFNALLGLVAFTGRTYGPQALNRLDHADALADDAYPEGVPYVWGLSEYPIHGNRVGKRRWLHLWKRAGFVIDGEPAERPKVNLVLYRGAIPSHRDGFSWSDNREVADHFAQARTWGKFKARTYRAVVPPANLLGYIHDNGRGEEEWVVNTYGLKIEEA